MFTQFDIIVSVIVFFFMLLGFFNGAIKTVFSIGKWVGAWYVTARFYPQASEAVGQIMQPGMMSNIVAVGGLFIISLVAIAIVGSMLHASIAGTAGGALDKGLGIFLGVVEGVLIASIMHYCVVLYKKGEPDWLREGETYQYTAEGAKMFDKMLKGRLDQFKVVYDDKLGQFADFIDNKEDYDMESLGNAISEMSAGGASDSDIKNKLQDSDFMAQFLKAANDMNLNINDPMKSKSDAIKNINKASPVKIDNNLMPIDE